jgi:hypothetical protein
MKRICLLALVVISGCLIYKPTGEYLTGEWTDFIPKEGVHYYAGQKIIVKFSNDSFYYHAEQWSDVEREGDTCAYYNNDVYAAGKYIIKQNNLYLLGRWTNYDYRNTKMHPCNDTGKFELMYAVDIQNKELVELKLKSPLPYYYDWRIREEMQMIKQK